MDGSRFDAWTRRRFGVAAGGAAATLFGLASLSDAAAKKKRKKRPKRCRKLWATCSPRGRRCCNRFKCRDVGDPDPEFRCCKLDGERCSGDDECCSGCNVLGSGRCEAA
jgi:hypothetical protein